MTAVTLGFQCHICGHDRGTTFAIREMMFGTEDLFHYVQCAQCECLQLSDPPSEWGRYYPVDYYAFEPPPIRRGVRQRLRVLRNAGTFGTAGMMARLLSRAMPYPLHGAERWFAGLGVSAASRILDVGCGNGMLVRDLCEAGFTAVLGIDPLIADTVVREGNGVIRRAAIGEIDGEFDVVMLHHSLEHIADQRSALSAVAARLRVGGWCLVRVPTVSSWAWEHYREHWVQVDAPRHFFLHSRESLARLGAAVGLRLVRTVDDSTDFQFTGSELYRSGRALRELPGAYSAGALREYRRQARALNAAQRGDQLACYFQKQAGS